MKKQYPANCATHNDAIDAYEHASAERDALVARVAELEGALVECLAELDAIATDTHEGIGTLPWGADNTIALSIRTKARAALAKVKV